MANLTSTARIHSAGQMSIARQNAGRRVADSNLLRFSELDILAFQFVFCGTQLAAADHGFAAAQLAARNQPNGPAARAGHDGHKRVLRMPQLGLILEEKHGSGVHPFRNPFFQELQVG